jgi:hypothetical protein
MLCDEICQAKEDFFSSMRNRLGSFALITEACSVLLTKSDFVICEKCRKALISLATQALKLMHANQQKELLASSRSPIISLLTLDILRHISQRLDLEVEGTEISAILARTVDLIADSDWLSLFPIKIDDPYTSELYVSVVTFTNSLRSLIKPVDSKRLNMHKLFLKIMNIPGNPLIQL